MEVNTEEELPRDDKLTADNHTEQNEKETDQQEQNLEDCGEAAFDCPSNSWDRSKLWKQWGTLSPEQDSHLSQWCKSRYKYKHGHETKRIEWLISALTESEMQAAMKFCTAGDSSILNIPSYKIAIVDDFCKEDVDGESGLWPASVPEASSKQSNAQQTGNASSKLTGVTKRGMAQPKKKR